MNQSVTYLLTLSMVIICTRLNEFSFASIDMLKIILSTPNNYGGTGLESMCLAFGT